MLLFKKGDDLANDIGEHSVHKKEKKVQAGDATNGQIQGTFVHEIKREGKIEKRIREDDLNHQ